MKLYEVGGCVRDRLLGIESKDIDYTVVLDNEDNKYMIRSDRVWEPYDIMVDQLEKMGIRVFRDKEGKPIGADYLTARGLAPANFPKHPGRALDFVLARKEGSYSDGRHPDEVQPGTLMDDLQRRDFTMNAIAEDEHGNLIDPFGGYGDIQDKMIYAVGDPVDRFKEDALRAIRAMRFAVTKDFDIALNVMSAMQHGKVLDDIAGDRISDERIRDELNRMLAFDTVKTINILTVFPHLTEAMFSGTVSLEATMKKRGK